MGSTQPWELMVSRVCGDEAVSSIASESQLSPLPGEHPETVLFIYFLLDTNKPGHTPQHYTDIGQGYAANCTVRSRPCVPKGCLPQAVCHPQGDSSLSLQLPR